ncbi:MAG: hypothetical protein KBT57_11660 [bacterium]|nr:hypothetical protein [Candidatus Limimorpha equi]
MATVSDRFTNQVNQLESDNTDVVIITPNEFSSLTDSQWTEIRELLLNDGAVVFLSPTDQDLKDFSETAVNSWDVFGNGDFSYFDIISRLEYLGDMSPDDSKADARYRAIGFCSNNILILPDYQGVVSTNCKSITLNTETLEVIDSTYFPLTGETVEYSVKDDLDDIVDWTNQSVKEARSQANGKYMDINNMGTNLTLSFNYTFNSDNLPVDDPGEKLKDRATREIKHDIICRVWSVYDLNNKKDIYLINQQLLFQGSKLNPEPTDESKWLPDARNRYRYYGPFLEYIACKTRFSDSNCQISDIKPSNPIGNTTYTSGQMWTLTGGLTVSQAPGVNIGGSFSLNNTVTTTIPDLEMTLNFERDNVRYKYAANSKIWPEGHFAGPHDTAKKGLHSDLNFCQSWICSVTPQDYSRYSLYFTYSDCILYLYSKDGFFEAIDAYRGCGNEWRDFPRDLPAPQRAIQEWRMFCNEAPYGSHLQQFLTDCYEKYFYNSPFQIADKAAGCRDAINLFIKDFEGRLRNDIDLWKNNEFFGTYHFTWQIGDNTYHTTEFTVNRD